MPSFLSIFTHENISAFFESYKAFGPIIAILLPLIEAFLPFLPLVVFAVANANAFGLWEGFLLTWIGASAGSILVFLLIRRFGQMRMLHFISRHPSIKKLMLWVEKRGFGPLFILLCFPFTPSAAVNVVAGLSRISIWQFSLAVFSGKCVMLLIISFVGYDLTALVKNPLRSIFAVLVIALLWYVGKRVENRLNIRMSKRGDKGGT
ncbi:MULTISPECIES: TVP38/TMEM64 family protein [unclassified Bacillus (in: firmicutes)]|uniref:TVP38/TMEM64 family protein n=1 Tax=Bacillus TaxID=1386 RepID=UPI00338F1574